ncbi:MAG: osmotically inducible protein OsmC [Elusimicrobia bacterium RIFOXYA12_FULL_51_18]|nr:MAG: osmotically inducible protein OsmC [Elusimicrobia bacterium RIFOXYA12_FULL_51_18]OGS32480.1 MAG: osmotically inducible protein OsmC [Elusimicrobia bacterium RIFOXYA2_FULL_53_38]
MSDMEITFGGNKKINAAFHGFEIQTDQPKSAGGDGSAPTPFDLFLASLGTCAGIFAVGFMQSRKLSTEGFKILLSFDWDESSHLVKKVTMKMKLPDGFPPQYKDAILKATGLCAVKRHLHTPPAFEITAE